MRRRTFLKKSAIGIGTLAGVCGGVLKAEEIIGNKQSVMAAHSGGGLQKARKEGQLAWGTNAVVLKSPWKGVPSVDDLLADSEHTVVLNRFYRVGGENRPATPTECRIAYNSDALFVVFRCEENDMSFPYANLDANWWRRGELAFAAWFALRSEQLASQSR